MRECSKLPELLELTLFAKWRSAVALIRTYSSHLFLVSKTVARPTLLLLLSILHKVWASPWNTWGDFWKKNMRFPHLDMFANMQVICVAWTHSCMGKSLWATHSIGDKWWHVFAPVVMEPLFCCRRLFFFYSLGFCKTWRPVFASNQHCLLAWSANLRWLEL